jgi:hypothetical protein
MQLVFSTFNEVPEVFVPKERKSELDNALKLVYNAHLVPGHATPWYRIQGATGFVDDMDDLSRILNEIVAAYDL